MGKIFHYLKASIGHKGIILAFSLGPGIYHTICYMVGYFLFATVGSGIVCSFHGSYWKVPSNWCNSAICVSQVFLSVTKSDYLCHYVGL